METIIVNWNLNKTNEQIQKVNLLISNCLDENGIFTEVDDFEIELKKIGYGWMNKENDICNQYLDTLYKTVYDILTQENIILSIPHAGTLLGFIREGKSIPHDDDHDITVDYNLISEKFEKIEEKLMMNNMSFWWNKSIFTNGLDNNWLPWTKIVTNQKFEVIIGEYYFYFHQSMDLFPMIKFNNFQEFLEIIKIYMMAYKHSDKSLLFSNKLKIIEDRKENLINLYGIDGYDKIWNLASEFEKHFNISEIIVQENLTKLNNLIKKDGKYFTTLDPFIYIKAWRECDEKLDEITLNDEMKFLSSKKFDQIDIEMFYGKGWNTNPGVGPLHKFNKWTFKGKKIQ